MTWIEAFGDVGSFLSAVTFIPQVIKVYKTKSAKDLSTIMLLIIITSTAIWLVYGIGLKLRPVIMANSIIFVLASWLLWFKLSHKQ